MDAASEPTNPAGRAVGAVLAGGRGTRIGGAKAKIELAARPLITYPLAAVEAAGLEPVVVAKRDSELPSLDVHVVQEPDRPQHPLCGIVAALRHAGERPLIVVGCDMPFVSAALLAWLGSATEPLVAASVGGNVQPLLARYDQTLRPALEAELARLVPLYRTIESLRPRVIDESGLARFGDPRRLCFNVNTPADLETAERVLETVER